MNFGITCYRCERGEYLCRCTGEEDYMSEINTFNKFMVASQGSEIVFLRLLPTRISQEDALLLAAYLVAMSEKPYEEFQKVFEAVCNT